MRWCGLLAALSYVLLPANAIFADDAFHVDYHHALLGSPQAHATFFHKPQTSTNASLLYTISDKGVLGAVNPKDGSLLWRQSLAGRPVDNASTSFLVAGERDGQIISGYDRTVSCWDALNGRLIWDYNVTEGSTIRGLQAIPVAGSGTSGPPQDVLVLAYPEQPAAHATLTRLAGDGSGVKWQHEDSSLSPGSSASIATSLQHVYYITKSHGLLASNKAKVVTLNGATGHEVGQHSVAIDSEPLGDGGHYSMGSWSASPCLVSADSSSKSLKFSLLESPKVATLALDDKGEDVQSITVHHALGRDALTHFLVHVRGKAREWAEVYHVDPASGEVSKAYVLPATEERSAFAATSSGSTVYFTRSTESEVILYSSESHGQLGRWRKTKSGGVSGNYPVHAVAEVVSKGDVGFALRLAEVSTSGDWSLIRNGELQWTRAEMLAYAKIASWGEDEGPDHLVEELDLESSVNPLTAYTHRIKRHLTDLMNLPAYLQSLPQTVLNSSPDSDNAARRNLVGSKTVIVGTARKELLALDVTNSGVLKWQTDLSKHMETDAVMKSIIVDEGRAHVFLSDGALIIVDASDGSILGHHAGKFPISNLVRIPGTPGPAVIEVESDGTPRPAEISGAIQPLEGSTVVTISEDGKASGWTIGQGVEKTWMLAPRNGMKFVNAVARAEHDQVASIGKVLGDRSVLYKYLSPNLVLLIAESHSDLTVYLVDAVTGAILHTATHQGLVPATDIPAVISENWYAYAFTSQDPINGGIATQIVISELYESSTPNDRGPLGPRTNFSEFSVDAGVRPHVISQAYTVAEPISNLAVSQTAQGITTRQVLATLPNSNAIVGIPREVLDARRPVDREPNATEREEGLLRYSPNIELDPRAFLTHSREVLGIQKIMASPSLLESTSIIFAFGHDVFGTQIAPSMAFDVLGKGFNKFQLVLTVVALFAGVLALRPLARKKTVEARWKQ
ncbi:ER membrane protein complex subunit 1 [Exophiala dermatitidis]